jgi:hypothetical protein
MRRPIIAVLAIPCLAGCMGGILAAQDTASTLNELNELLAQSCSYAPVLMLAADGTIFMKNSNGVTMTFNLREIGEITIDQSGVRPDVQGHVILPCAGACKRVKPSQSMSHAHYGGARPLKPRAPRAHF